MADRLKVTELDFDTIKNNLKNFLKQQNEFTDYDFEGAGLSVLLDILAYNTHYNSYYLNMVANEAFLDTALLRNSVVSHAKSLGYTPYSAKAPVAIINMEVPLSGPSFISRGTLTIPVGYKFLSEQIDGKSYNFVVLESKTAHAANNSYYFENLEIHEGQLINYKFNYDEGSNPKQIFTLPEANIDTSTIKVLVFENSTTTNYKIYQKVTDIVDVTGESEVYFLQESRTGQYQIYFGNNFVGKKLPAGAVIIVSYLVTNGIAANKANNFVGTSALGGAVEIGPETPDVFTNFIITSVSEASGGSEKEPVDSIRYSATNSYTTQNRLITYKDYESFIMSNYPNLDSVSVWGGEDEVLPVYGKVFISLKPKNNFFISETEKQRIIDDILKPRSAISTDIVIREPEYLYLKLINKVIYDDTKTILTNQNIKGLVNSTIQNYFDLNVNKFNSTFSLSKLHQEINKIDAAIVGTETDLKLEKRFLPTLNTRKSYVIDFNAELGRGSSIDKLSTTEFQVFDNFGERRTVQIEEIPESFSGISDVVINNPGANYTSIPTVKITGDGTGASARAKIVNGRIDSIEILNRGVNYTRAIIQIEGGGGFGAVVTPILNSRFGTLRLIYFDVNAERQIVNSNIGTINYDEGRVELNNLNVISVNSSDGYIRLTVRSENQIVSSFKNTLITIDNTDPTSIVVNTEKL